MMANVNVIVVGKETQGNLFVIIGFWRKLSIETSFIYVNE